LNDRRWCAAKEAIARFGPDAQANSIGACGLAKLLTPTLLLAERVTHGFDDADALRFWGGLLPRHLDRRRRDRERYKNDGA
jgi:hypothetical protein